MAPGNREVLAWFKALARVYSDNRQWLTDLDAAIGDADHGSNMERGFTAVHAELPAKAPADIRSTMQLAATVLIRTVGGASGPLYGTFFLRAAAASEGKTSLEPADMVALFEAGVQGIEQRGKAQAGDKTMLDALLPAVAAMRNCLAGGSGPAEILAAGVSAAEAGMQATIPMQARKGRASYLGPRSVGHQDPGATSAWLLVKTAADAWSPGPA
jgi:phosphoenolpyruvate---glycerone phosphotransferase subunit DhaL